MKELIDIKKIYTWCVNRWKDSFSTILIALAALLFGMAIKEKLITEDCRFMGSFRDGAQVYNCQQRVR